MPPIRQGSPDRELLERVERLERAVGQLAYQLNGVGGSGRLAVKAPDLAALMRQHEIAIVRPGERRG